MNNKEISGDPYFYAQQTFDKRLQETKELFEKWKAVNDTSEKKGSGEDLRQYTRNLLLDLDDMENLISELTRCMTMIESNKGTARFKDIDNEELERRKKYLSDIRVVVHSMRDNMRKQRMTIRKETKEMKESLLNEPEETQEELASKGNRFIKEQFVKEQEEMIDEISSGVQRLNNMAHSIQDEIQEHSRLIDGIEVEVDVAQTRLEHSRRQIERYLQTNNWCKIKAIIILFFVALFYIFVVLFT